MGLLDEVSIGLDTFLPDDPQKKEAVKMGLLNFGAQMLASSQQGLAPALGRGIGAGTQAYSGQLQQQQANALRQMQLAEAQRKATINQGMSKAAKDSMLTPAQATMTNGQGPSIANAAQIGTTAPQFDTDGYINRVMAIDPVQGLQLRASMAKETPFSKIDPKDYTPESVARFAQTRSFGDLQPVRKMDVVNNQAVDLYKTQPGTHFDNINPNQPFSMVGGKLVPNQPFQAFSLNKASAGAARNNVDARTIHTQENEQSKVYGRSLGEIRSNITNAAFKAPGTLAKVGRLEELLKGVDTGTTTALQIAQVADSFGLKLDPKLGQKEAAESITRELAGALREPGTGTSTDFDFQNWLQQVPGLTKTPEGRAEIFKTMRAKAARDIEIGKLARTYSKENHGVIDDGFMDVVSDYVAKNPVTQRTSTSGRADVFPVASAIEEELKRRAGGK